MELYLWKISLSKIWQLQVDDNGSDLKVFVVQVNPNQFSSDSQKGYEIGLNYGLTIWDS